jgi:hypothetical protein
VTKWLKKKREGRLSSEESSAEDYESELLDTQITYRNGWVVNKK